MESEDNDSGNCENDELLWSHVAILEEADSPEGEIVKFLCDYCNRVLSGNYSKVAKHLLKDCIGVTETIRAQVRNEFLAPKRVNARTIPTGVPWTSSAAGSSSCGTSGKVLVQAKKRKKSTTLDEDHCMEARGHLDTIIARMFYSSGYI